MNKKENEKLKGDEEIRGKSALTRGGNSMSMQEMRNISSAVSKENTSVHPFLHEEGTKIDWQEQRKLLKKRQVVDISNRMKKC